MKIRWPQGERPKQLVRADGAHLPPSAGQKGFILEQTRSTTPFGYCFQPNQTGFERGKADVNRTFAVRPGMLRTFVGSGALGGVMRGL